MCYCVCYHGYLVWQLAVKGMHGGNSLPDLVGGHVQHLSNSGVKLGMHGTAAFAKSQPILLVLYCTEVVTFILR